MKNKILIWAGLFSLFFAIPQVAKAELGCSGGCTGAQVCAEFPSSVTTTFTEGIHPSGCFSTASAPTVTPVVDGISYCTDNIFDGMESTTQCSTSTTKDGKWFHWLTGSLNTDNGSVCLLPGDVKSSTIMSTTCTTTSNPIDPISTLPPTTYSSTETYTTAPESFSLRNFHLEAAIDCSETETVYSVPHNVNYELSSPNYPNNYNDNYDHTWTITHAGATKMAVHFDSFVTESWSDYVTIYDGNDQYIQDYSGDKGSFQSVVVDGDTIKIQFYADSSNNYSGWHIDRYTYYETTTGTLVVAPKVKLYFDVPAISDYDFWGSIYRGTSATSMTSDIYDYSYTETPTVLNYTDDTVENNSTYYYTTFNTGDNSGYYFDDSWQSEYIAVNIQCTDPIGSDPQLNSGFNVSAEKISNNIVDLEWEANSEATQYYITKNNEPIFSSSNWTNYFFHTGDEYTEPSHDWYYADEVQNSNTNYLNYVTGTSFTDNNASLSNPTDSITYRIYSVLPDDFIAADGYDDWDGNSYTWNTRYPWDHNLVLSEEVIVYGNGTVDDPNPDPVDNGTSLQPCSGTCITSADCDSGLFCISSQCRNSSCPSESGCACAMNPAFVSSLTDVLSNNFTTRPSKHTLWYDIRIDTVVTNGSLLVTFPSDFNFGSLASGDITTSGGDVTWGSSVVNSGNHTVVVPFTGTLNKDDGRVTIVVGNTNFITNPVIVDSYLINLTSHASADGSGSSVDNVSDEVILRGFDSEGTSSLSDTLSVSLTSYDSRHTLRYNIGTPPAITDGSVKVILATEFDLSGLVPADISVLGGDVTWGTATVNPSTKTIVIPFTGTLDNTDTLITLLFGNTNFINNPSNTGSYQVRLSTHNSTDGTGSAVEDLTANVAITGGVTVTATVPSSLTFTVLPVASAQSVNGTTTTTTSTASLINFGIIEPSLSKIAAHDLQVSTNSTNGFVVTLQSLSNFTSPGGDTISDFTGTNATPISWTSPTTTHSFFGYTTSDYTLHDSLINRFQSNKWSGPSTTPSEVMYYTDPVNGVGEGLTRVGYQIEIDNLQPAGIYQTNLMYLCTATY